MWSRNVMWKCEEPRKRTKWTESVPGCATTRSKDGTESSRRNLWTSDKEFLCVRGRDFDCSRGLDMLLPCCRYQGLIIHRTNMLFLLIVTILGYQVIIGLELGNRSSLIDSHRISKRLFARPTFSKTFYNTTFIYVQLSQIPSSYLLTYLSFCINYPQILPIFSSIDHSAFL